LAINIYGVANGTADHVRSFYGGSDMVNVQKNLSPDSWYVPDKLRAGARNLGSSKSKGTCGGKALDA